MAAASSTCEGGGEGTKVFKVFILDTNVVLSLGDEEGENGPLGQLIYAIAGARAPLPPSPPPPPFTLLIPWVVLSELEGLQHGEDPTRGDLRRRAAAANTRLLHLLRGTASGLSPELTGILVAQSASDARDASLLLPELTHGSADNKILQCALSNKGAVLITNDTNLRSKAVGVGVSSFNEEEVKQVLIVQGVGGFFEGLGQGEEEGSGSMRERMSDVRGDLIGIKDVAVDKVKGGMDAREYIETCVASAGRALEPLMESAFVRDFGEMWKEVVFIAPPWTGRDALAVLSKHWSVLEEHLPAEIKKEGLTLLKVAEDASRLGVLVSNMASEVACKCTALLLKACFPILSRMHTSALPRPILDAYRDVGYHVSFSSSQPMELD